MRDIRICRGPGARYDTSTPPTIPQRYSSTAALHRSARLTLSHCTGNGYDRLITLSEITDWRYQPRVPPYLRIVSDDNGPPPTVTQRNGYLGIWAVARMTGEAGATGGAGRWRGDKGRGANIRGYRLTSFDALLPQRRGRMLGDLLVHRLRSLM